MPSSILYLDPIKPRAASVMTTAELAEWCGLGKNSIPRLIDFFGIRELSRSAKNHKFSTYEVMRKVLGVTPDNADDMAMLLYPLQKSAWVSEQTGLSVSGINAAICEKRLQMPSPVELTRTNPTQAAARSRRWIPAQIDAYLKNDPIPFVTALTPCLDPKPQQETTSRNAFAAIFSDNAKVSRQSQL